MKWSAERCTRWVVADTDDAQGEEKEARKAAREEREERRRVGDESVDAEELRHDESREAARRSAARGGTTATTRAGTTTTRACRGADGVLEEEEGAAIDPEDDAILLRLYQRKVGPLRGAGKQPLQYEHLFVDEAQGPLAHRALGADGRTSQDRSVTLAGDTAQRLLMDNGFSDWKGVLRDLGLAHVEVEPLRIGYRSTSRCSLRARGARPLADPEPPLATRHGAPVEFHSFGDVARPWRSSARPCASSPSRSRARTWPCSPATPSAPASSTRPLARAEVPRSRSSPTRTSASSPASRSPTSGR
ncbi:MAG: hypothetical protein R3A52_13855 [Polyangiales bacterium]